MTWMELVTQVVWAAVVAVSVQSLATEGRKAVEYWATMKHGGKHNLEEPDGEEADAPSATGPRPLP